MRFTDCNPSGPERRHNGKLKLTAGEYIKIFSTITILIVGGTIGYFTIKWTVTANAQEIAEASTEITNIKEVDKKQEKAIIILQSDITNIKEDVKEIIIVQKDSQKLLYKILGALND